MLERDEQLARANKQPEPERHVSHFRYLTTAAYPWRPLADRFYMRRDCPAAAGCSRCEAAARCESEATCARRGPAADVPSDQLPAAVESAPDVSESKPEAAIALITKSVLYHRSSGHDCGIAIHANDNIARIPRLDFAIGRAIDRDFVGFRRRSSVVEGAGEGVGNQPFERQRVVVKNGVSSGILHLPDLFFG